MRIGMPFWGNKNDLKGGIMCLSNVYLDEKKEEKLLIQEVSQVRADNQNVQVQTLMGESKSLEGYYICEVDLVDNYVILEKRKGA